MRLQLSRLWSIARWLALLLALLVFAAAIGPISGAAGCAVVIVAVVIAWRQATVGRHLRAAVCVVAAISIGALEVLPVWRHVGYCTQSQNSQELTCFKHSHTIWGTGHLH